MQKSKFWFLMFFQRNWYQPVEGVISSILKKELSKSVQRFKRYEQKTFRHWWLREPSGPIVYIGLYSPGKDNSAWWLLKIE